MQKQQRERNVRGRRKVKIMKYNNKYFIDTATLSEYQVWLSNALGITRECVSNDTLEKLR